MYAAGDIDVLFTVCV